MESVSSGNSRGYVNQALKSGECPGVFIYSSGPTTPGHLTYATAFPFSTKLTETALANYKIEHGHAPKVVVYGDRIYGIGTSQENADRALDLAQDGALVMQLAEAFGGIEYMTDSAREFIERRVCVEVGL